MAIMPCLICGAPIERLGVDHIHDPETGALIDQSAEPVETVDPIDPTDPPFVDQPDPVIDPIPESTEGTAQPSEPSDGTVSDDQTINSDPLV